MFDKLIDDFSRGGKYHNFYDKTEDIFRAYRDSKLREKASENLPPSKGENLDNDRELTSFDSDTKALTIDFGKIKNYLKSNPLIVMVGTLTAVLFVSLFRGGK